MLQPCPAKNQQHGGPKHPGQPSCDSIFCAIPSESCWEEPGNTAGLLHPRGGTAKDISQNPSALKHPQSPWSQLRDGPGCCKVPPHRVQGKGLTGSVGAGTTQGQCRDHTGTTGTRQGPHRVHEHYAMRRPDLSGARCDGPRAGGGGEGGGEVGNRSAGDIFFTLLQL